MAIEMMIERLESRLLLSSAAYLQNVLAEFNSVNGATPQAGVVVDSSGDLFGVTSTGGDNGDGTIFEVAAGSGTITVLASFNTATDGGDPQAGLLMDSSGNLYGTTNAGGGSGDGIIFELANGSGTIQTLASFNGTNGLSPAGTLVMDSSGNLYGVASAGGADAMGSIFELISGSNTITTLASFNGTNGATPLGGMVLDSSGDLFGTTSIGGKDNDGVIFELPAGSGNIVPLISFRGTNGQNPMGDLITDAVGDLFGVCNSGGAKNDGTIFEVVNGTTALDTLATFHGPDGQNPNTGMILDGDGNLFGVTAGGGANSDGTVFEVAQGTNKLSMLASFNGTNGMTPFGLAIDARHQLYGTTSAGGLNSDGVVFQLVPASAQLAFIQQPTNLTAGSNFSPSVTVKIEDQFGQLVSTDNSNVTLSVFTGPGGGKLSGTFTVAANDGLATFTGLGATIAGSYVIQASDGSLSTINSAPFTVVAGASAKLAFIQQPGNSAAGAAISPAVVVAVEDAFGNFVDADTSLVTLGIASGPNGGTLGGMISLSAVGGIATFSDVVLTKIGAYKLAASALSLTGVTSARFNVSAGAASVLLLAQVPSHATVDATITPPILVKVEDDFGNIIGTDTSNVTLSFLTGPRTGAITTVAAVNGIASFDSVSFPLSGKYTLQATDGSLASSPSGTIVISEGPAVMLAFVDQPINATAGNVIAPSVTVQIEDAQGDLESKDNSTITISVLTGPNGSIVSGTSSVTAVHGLATFSNLIFDTAGTYTLTAATTNEDLTAGTSDTFTIRHTTAAGLTFSPQPANATAGVAIGAFTVEITDKFGNVCAGNSSTVKLHIATGPLGAILTGQLKVAAVAGVASFSGIVTDTAGTLTLSATDPTGSSTGGPLATGTSAAFTVAPGAAVEVHFAVNPVNATAGAAIAPAILVKVKDAFGNKVIGDTSSITLAIASGPNGAVLGGTTTVAAVNGRATFSNISITEAGTYTLTATDGSLSPGFSQSFTIKHAAPTKLLFVQEPTNSTVNAVISPPVTVEVVDAFGNLCGGNTTTIALSIFNGLTGFFEGDKKVAAIAGVATFSDLYFTLANNYILQANGSKQANGSRLTKAVSTQVTIS